MIVYFDRNIILDLYEKRKGFSCDIYKFCNEKKYIIPYSPAHIEEIVSARVVHLKNDFNNQIDFIKNISGERALFSSRRDERVLIPSFYKMEDCVRNVQDNGGRNATEIAIYKEKLSLLERKNMEDNNDVFKKIRIDISKNHDWSNIFCNKYILDALNQMAIRNNFRIMTDTFENREKTIEILYKIIDFYGFKKDDNIKKSENRLHDISHIIYASYADIFITKDKKLKEKSKAIYKFISIKTKVFDDNEFYIEYIKKD